MNDSKPNTTHKQNHIPLPFIKLGAEITITRGLNSTVRWQNQVQHVNFTKKMF